MFAKKIQNFLNSLPRHVYREVKIVPKSSSSLQLGDLVYFMYYKKNLKKVDKDEYLGIIVKPIVVCKKTGNRLLTLVKIEEDQYEDVAIHVFDLYKKRPEILPENAYRTFILSNVTNLAVINAELKT